MCPKKAVGMVSKKHSMQRSGVALFDGGDITKGVAGQLEAASALWTRVPTRDAEGKPLSDFMMIFPKTDFKHKPQFDLVVDQIQQVLYTYDQVIVFADLNVKLKLLWVSIHAIPGMCLEISTAINYRIPDSRLVSHRF